MVKMVNIRKRGKVYQYQFEIAKVEGIAIYCFYCYNKKEKRGKVKLKIQ